jgi:nucleoside-diphosphate-sugar epimerase
MPARVVVGATGALGAAVVRHLVAAGAPVRAVARDAGRAQALLPAGVEVVTADALHREGVVSACAGAKTIYHCLNVPYQEWMAVMPHVTTNVLQAAQEHDAVLVFPGNVYGYGKFKRIPTPESHPRTATSRKGQLRNALEQTLTNAHQGGQVRVVIPRLPDFYGPHVTNKLFGEMIFAAAVARRTVKWVGRLDVLHDFVFIDDAAAACVRLGQTEAAWGDSWHVPGAGPLTAREFLTAVCRAAQAPVRMSALPAWLLTVAGFFADGAREVAEIAYLFTQPQVLDGSKFRAAFPEFRFTPHEEAIARTVAWFQTRRG